jgi:hypothetical protein
MVRPAGLEPATTRLEGGCSIQLSYGRVLELSSTGCKNGRSGGIRTPDILLPKQTRYRAALHSETFGIVKKLSMLSKTMKHTAFQEVRMIAMGTCLVNDKMLENQFIRGPSGFRAKFLLAKG